MEISSYFSSIDFENKNFKKGFLGNHVKINNGSFPDLSLCEIALIYIPEERNAINNKGCSLGSDKIRESLYNLTVSNENLQIADLGNLIVGETTNDTYQAASFVISELIKLGKFAFILGGGNDLAYSNYLAYEKLEQILNIVSIDNSFDLGDVDDTINSMGYLNKIILHHPNYLFNYSNLGYQSYFVTNQELDLMNKLYFDVYRLGEVKANIKEVEPVVRNADMITFDISAVRYADANGNRNATPNGFNGEDACAITRYAGISDKLSSLGIYEYNSSFDKNGQTALLIAQMIWYFFEGFSNRKAEEPLRNKKEFLKYIVNAENGQDELVFYKNVKTDRWWMDVPHPKNAILKYKRHQMVPCSYEDYKEACKDMLPEKWIRTYQKLL